MSKVMCGGKVYNYNYADGCEESVIRSINNRRKREIQLRRRIITFCVLASIIVFFFLFLTFSFNSDASISSDHKQERYYTTVIVKSGDSVRTIAEEHMDNLHYRNADEFACDIASVNRISVNCELTTGTNIVIPYYSDMIK